MGEPQIYNIAMFASPAVREEYRRRNRGHDPSVRGNDIAFAVHVRVATLQKKRPY
jgi:cystinosin